ncbi:YrdB family protein [Streptomyces sp. NPDC006733]|uniref:YrdB family protein n=1 Tax=Streptomyces sp. NPDC006733 TaxID=3155460 RepID=UPI0033D1EFA7
MRIVKPGPVKDRKWTPLTVANGALALALEGGLLAALFFWGLETASGTLAGIALGVGSATLAGVVWGLFLAAGGPRFPLPAGPEIAIKLAVLGVAALALADFGHVTGGWIFAGLALLSVAVEYTEWGAPGETG